VFARALPLAITQLKEARQRRPEDVALLLGLGEALVHLKRTDDYREVFLKVVELEPRNAFALAHVGHAFFSAGKYDAALKYLERAATEEPWNGQTHKLLALAWVKKKEFARAAAVCKKWLENQPASAEARIVLAHCRAREGKSAEAAAMLKTAESLMTPRDREFLDWFTKHAD
jgi:tetratricopeptide (TPR) repeat protein